ncbi:MAG TPA: M23 family metallopeptidase [Anaeromyxobacteraceae bacterium]|nr:M23 family metallopeptidase [Anaeromyxobacteraceae bacterium]
MIALAAALALALAADPAAQLESVRARRAAEEAAARALSSREASLLGALDDAQRALAAASAESSRAEAERAVAEEALRVARAESDQVEAKLTQRLEVLRPRLEARARMSRMSALRLIAGSGSLSDISRRRFLLDRILARDAALLREARALKDDREKARAQHEAAASRLVALATQATQRRDEAARRREEQEALLRSIRSEKGVHARAAAEAAEQERRLSLLLVGVEPGRGFAGLRGRLPLPAPGRIEAGYGRVVDPRFNTVTQHPGLDIRAPEGTPVRAVADGRVVHAGWFRGYGNIVIVDHGDGYHTLVAHLGSMRTAVGEEVEAGTVLGTVGDTGSLKGPFLYFEIRERQRPVDPTPWLTR